MTDQEKDNLKALRKEWVRLIMNCSCVRKRNGGRCRPFKCYPQIYKLLYPRAGLYRRTDRMS